MTTHRNKAWSRTEDDLARDLRLSIGAVAEQTGRTPRAVEDRRQNLRHAATMPPENAAIAASLPLAPEPINAEHWDEGYVRLTTEQLRPCPHALADRDHRASLRPNVYQAVLGDPPKGYSALDRKDDEPCS